MNFFISNAFADTKAAAPQNEAYSMIIMLVLFAVIFYFMILRPQQKRSKAHQSLMSSISIGDEVQTNGGLVGKVTKVNENGYLVIELNENNNVIIKRDFITAVLPKGTINSI